MTIAPRCAPKALLLLRCAPLVALLTVLPCQAQFKVVGPDGKVTYTDSPPAANEGRVTSLSGRFAVGSGDANLPLELRNPVARYPVTLYVMASACDPCESARQLLRQRGIPYNEKQVVTPEDSEALERLSGGRDAPTLTIGAQTLRGLSSELWNTYLDGAGYPRESRLPKNFEYAAATPITERREAAVTPVVVPPKPAAQRPAPAAEVPADKSTIRF